MCQGYEDFYAAQSVPDRSHSLLESAVTTPTALHINIPPALPVETATVQFMGGRDETGLHSHIPYCVEALTHPCGAF